MSIRIKSALAALLVTTVAHPALAEGWYGGPFAMVGFTDHDNYERTPATVLPISGDSDNAGLSGGAGLWGGYDFGGWALELGGSYRARHDANFSFTDITSGLNNGAKANVQTADLILSAIYDIPVKWSVTPYIGAGAGMSYNRLDSELLTGGGITDAGTSSSWEFAWQLQGGLKYPMSETSHLRLDYRYVDLGTIETSALPTATNDRLSADLASHDIRIGWVWGF